MAQSKSRELPDGHDVRLDDGTVQVKGPGPRGQWISVADHAEASKALVYALRDAIELAALAAGLRFELRTDEIANRIVRGEIDPDEDFDTDVGLDELDAGELADRIDEIPEEVLDGERRELPDGHDLLIEPGSVKVKHDGRWVGVAENAEACEVLADLVRAERRARATVAPRRRRSRAEAPDDALSSTGTLAGAAVGALVAGPLGAVVGGLVGLLGDEPGEQDAQHEPGLTRAVVYNDVLGMGATDDEARADALARGEDLEMAEYTDATPAALFAWKSGQTDLVTLAPNGCVHRVDVNDTPKDWKGTINDPASDNDTWRRPRQPPRSTAARRRRSR
jgi:hypothetical protein